MMSRHACLLLFAALLAPCSALCGTVPFRLVLYDSYESIEEYDREASDVVGLRLGIFSTCNKRMYGISVSIFDDGTSGPPERMIADDDWAGLKIGGLNSESCGSGIGIQAGMGCRTDGRMTGLQIGGFGSDCGTLNGLQIGGLMVFARMGMRGIQIAGLNAVVGNEELEGVTDAYGIQISALRSRFWHGTFTGLQVGATTFADELSGVQIGALNKADTLHGLQIGVVNRARDLHGVQIGIVNISGDENGGNYRFLPLLNARF